MSALCKICDSQWHYQTFCPLKKKKPILSTKSKKRNAEIKRKFIKANPPDENGQWICYLCISKSCPLYLDENQMTVEHVIPKSRGKKYLLDMKNLKPACYTCNMIKGSRTIDSLAKDYPHLKYKA